MNIAEAEADVERERLQLEQTLERLRENLRPRRLVQEAASGGRWLPRFWAFARGSTTSWALMGAAAALMGWDVRNRCV